MSNNQQPPPKPEVTPNWQEILYSKDRVEQFLKGELTMAQLMALSGPEMLRLAIIGFHMYEQGRYAEAKTVFQGLVTLDPTEAYYQTALGAVYLAEDDLDTAKWQFDTAINANPKELAAYVNRGEVYLRQGKVLEAAHDFMKAVELDPESKDPLTNRAKVLAAAALETIEQVQKEQGAAEKKAAAPAAPAKKK